MMLHIHFYRTVAYQLHCDHDWAKAPKGAEKLDPPERPWLNKDQRPVPPPQVHMGRHVGRGSYCGITIFKACRCSKRKEDLTTQANPDDGSWAASGTLPRAR